MIRTLCFMVVCSILTFFTSGCLINFSGAESREVKQPGKIKFMVYGDSISAGLWRGFTQGQDLNAADFAKFFIQSQQQTIRNPPTKLNDVFSGLETVMEGIDLYYKNSEFAIDHAFGLNASAACGSLACRLRLDTGSVGNYAKSGSLVADVKTQLTSSKMLDPNLTRLDDSSTSVSVISVGGNDFCQDGYNLDATKTDLKRLVAELQKTSDIILLVPPPNIVSLFSEDVRGQIAFQIPVANAEPTKITCSQIHDQLQICPRVRQKLLANSSDPKTLKQLNQEYQDLIDAFDEQESSKGGEVVKVVSGVKDEKLIVSGNTQSSLAFDCFHPSEEGHKKIAEISWKVLEELIPKDESTSAGDSKS